MANKRILLVSRSIPPSKGGTSSVIDNFLYNFEEDEIVVVGGSKKPPFIRKKYIGNIKSYYFYTQFSFFGRGGRFFKIFRWFLFPYYLHKLKNICNEERIDCIMGIYPDNYYLYASYILSKRTNLPFHTYFHNTYLENRKGIHRWFAEIIQPKIFSRAKNIFVISEGMKNFYQKTYPELFPKFTTLVHTYNIKPDINRNFNPDKNMFELVLFGNFNESNIDSTIVFLECIKNCSRFDVHFYSHVPSILLKARGIDTSKFHFHGYVNDENFFNSISSHDIGIITHGFTGGYSAVEYETIFPTRTIPHLLSGNPLLIISPENSFLSRFVKEHKFAVLITESEVDQICNKLNSIIENKKLRSKLKNQTDLILDYFNGKKVVKKFNEDINK